MSEQRLTVGQAIDQIARVLESFDGHQRITILSTVCNLLQIQQSSVSAPTSGTPPQLHQQPAKPQAVERPGSVIDGKNLKTGLDLKPVKIGADVTQLKNVVDIKTAKHSVDIRALRNEKQPATDREMACLAAYYVTECAPESERRETVTNADIEKLFKQAGFRLPESVAQLLIDSKRIGYLEATARGEYKLTRVGYNLVVHNLPRKNNWLRVDG
jgi:hypothetical protein